MPRQRFVAGKGGSIIYYPPEALVGGPPSAATVSIARAVGGALPEPVDGAACLIDPTDTVLAQAGEVGARTLHLADVAGVVPGRKFLVTAGDDGQLLDLEVVGVSVAGSYVRLRSGLARDLPAGSAFQGWQVSFVLTAENTPTPVTLAAPELDAGATQGLSPYLYRAEVTYELGGVPYPTADLLYEVRRRVLKPVISPADVQPRLPGEVADADLTAEDVADAWDDVLDALASHGLDADRVMNPDRLRLPHILWTLANAGDTWGPAWREWAETKRTQAKAALESALDVKDWYDVIDDKRATQGESVITSVRLVR